MRQLVLSLFAATMLPSALFAQGVSDQIIQSLQSEPGPIVRSMGSQIPLQASQPIPSQFDFPKVILPVEFQPDTALLTANGMTLLRDLAFALQDAGLAGSSFQVGSHVKASGAAAAAQPVSNRRAQVIVEHLVAFYGVDQQRLVAVGYGQAFPLNAADPANLQNDRIELINVDELTR